MRSAPRAARAGSPSCRLRSPRSAVSSGGALWRRHARTHAAPRVLCCRARTQHLCARVARGDARARRLGADGGHARASRTNQLTFKLPLPAPAPSARRCPPGFVSARITCWTCPSTQRCASNAADARALGLPVCCTLAAPMLAVQAPSQRRRCAARRASQVRARVASACRLRARRGGALASLRAPVPASQGCREGFRDTFDCRARSGRPRDACAWCVVLVYSILRPTHVRAAPKRMRARCTSSSARARGRMSCV
jgi:hypothetical protein